MDGRTFKTRAFVLPERPGDAGRFAVSWDGVIDPASSVGPAADLDADVRALAESMQGDRGNAAAGKAGRSRGRRILSSSRRGGRFGPGGPSGAGDRSRAEALPPAPARPGRPGGGPVRRRDDLDTRDPGPRPHRLSYQLPDARPGMGRHGVHPAGGRPHARRRRDRAGRRPAAVGVRHGGGGQGRGDGIRARAGPVRQRRPAYFPFLRQLPELLADQERRAKEARARGRSRGAGPTPRPGSRP